MPTFEIGMLSSLLLAYPKSVILIKRLFSSSNVFSSLISLHISWAVSRAQVSFHKSRRGSQVSKNLQTSWIDLSATSEQEICLLQSSSGVTHEASSLLKYFLTNPLYCCILPCRSFWEGKWQSIPVHNPFPVTIVYSHNQLLEKPPCLILRQCSFIPDHKSFSVAIFSCHFQLPIKGNLASLLWKNINEFQTCDF